MSSPDTIVIPVEVFNQLASFVAEDPAVRLMETLMKLAAKHREEVENVAAASAPQ